MNPSPAAGVDLSTCDREAIHIPGSIQPHGILLAASTPDLRLVEVSANAAIWLGVRPEELFGRPVQSALVSLAPRLDPSVLSTVHSRDPVSLGSIEADIGGIRNRLQAVMHRNRDDRLIIELEAAVPGSADLSFHQIQALVSKFMSRLQEASSVRGLNEVVAAEVRSITGFDRVLVYRFDEDWNGTVVAENRNENLPSYLGLRFPASDIPAQARELYHANRLRLIPDAGYAPVPLLRAPGWPAQALDLSHAVLRSVSPIHIEYMNNMGSMASMSISIIHEGRLWGLISCHNATPKHVSFELRTACDLVGQVFSLQLTAKSHNEEYETSLQRKEIHSQLLAFMAQEENFVHGLTRHEPELLSLVRATGAAVVFGGQIALLGVTPDEDQVRALVDWIASRSGEDFHTDHLADELSQAPAYLDRASGILAISISELHNSYVLWFRPEVIRTVAWGGDPRKPVEAGADRLHPRKSFEIWKETVRRRSEPWSAVDVEAARELRRAIVGIVLRKAEELADITAELERSNRELEAFSYSVSHDLRAPFRHIVGYAELLGESDAGHLTEAGRRYLHTISESAQYAGKLVDNLLTFSQIGRSALARVPVDMNAVVREARMRFAPDISRRNIEFRIAELPWVEGDPALLRLAVNNLLSNAIKYTRPRDKAVIEVGADSLDKEFAFWVRDNGVGFEMEYVDKLFGVFQRLHRAEEFEGTGIGLANVRRIISRHGGRTWAESELNRGATFFFSLPRPARGIAT